MRSIAILGLFCAPLFAAEPPRQRPQYTTTERFNFAPGGTIRLIETRGNVSVEGWDRPEVEIAVTRSMRGLDSKDKRDRAVKELQAVQVKVEHRSPTEAVVTTRMPKRGFIAGWPAAAIDLDYVVHVPRESHVTIRHRDGMVLLTDVAGEIDASARAGDIVAMLPNPGPYAIDARSKFGTVTSDFGDVRQRHLVGQSFAATSGTHRVRLRTGIGGISIQEIRPGGY